MNSPSRADALECIKTLKSLRLYWKYATARRAIDQLHEYIHSVESTRCIRLADFEKTLRAISQGQTGNTRFIAMDAFGFDDDISVERVALVQRMIELIRKEGK